MPDPLELHGGFTAVSDPESGVLSYVLTRWLAPFQKGWYFLTPDIGPAGRHLWFRVSFPPATHGYIAILDLENPADEGRWFPHLPFTGNPILDETGERAYVPMGDAIYTVTTDGAAERLFKMPKQVLKGRHLFRLVTDLTLSSDGRTFLLDSVIGNQSVIGLVDRESGEYTALRTFPRQHHHTIFSLHDPTLFLVNHAHGNDVISGERYEMDVRQWVMDTELTRYAPLDPDLWFGRNSRACHEWWTPGGKVQFCEYESGIWEIDIDSREKELIWPHPLVHGQVSPDEAYLCGDENPYNWNERKPCRVWFFNRAARKEIAIVSAMPPQPLPWEDFRTYHIDPHPHFTAGGRYVSYTTVYDGKPTLALCPTAQAAARAATHGRAV